MGKISVRFTIFAIFGGLFIFLFFLLIGNPNPDLKNSDLLWPFLKVNILAAFLIVVYIYILLSLKKSADSKFSEYKRLPIFLRIIVVSGIVIILLIPVLIFPSSVSLILDDLWFISQKDIAKTIPSKTDLIKYVYSWPRGTRSSIFTCQTIYFRGDYPQPYYMLSIFLKEYGRYDRTLHTIYYLPRTRIILKDYQQPIRSVE